jgi:polysaccharide biosynthesis protein PslL
MDETKQRKVWVDVIKGIAILFVLITHHPLINQKNFYFSFFSIPLFFFISGYLFKSDVSFKTILKKRFDSLLKPYLFTAILVSLVYLFFKGAPSFLWYFFWIVFGNSPNLPKYALHLWFLPCLFMTTFFVWFVFKYFTVIKRSLINQCLLICGLFICGYFVIHSFWELKIPLYVTNFFMGDGHLFLINGLVDNPNYPKAQLLKDNQFTLMGLPWTLDAIFLTAAFFICGYLVKLNKLEKYFYNSIIASMMVFIFFIFQYLFNYEISFSDRHYDHLIIPTLVTLAAIYACVFISNAIGKWDNYITKMLKYIGKYSLIIFIFHPIFQSKTCLLGLKILPNEIALVSVIAFIVGVCLPLFLNFLILKRFKIFRFWFYS